MRKLRGCCSIHGCRSTGKDTKMAEYIKLTEITNDAATAIAELVESQKQHFHHVEKKIDELWTKARRKNQKLLDHWIACFPGQNNYEQRQNSKMEAKKTLTLREYQTDPTKNFFCKLMSNEPRSHGYGNRRKDDLAILFLQAMGEDPYWKDLLLKTFLELLHIAARFENLEEVKRLMTRIEKHPEITKIDSLGHGFTPLHSVAMAIHPNAEIAELLIQFDSKNGQKWLNKKSEPEKNTALHIAASNVNVTEDFIKQFKEADSKLQNRQGNTPYHVAARSSNQKTIVHMLNTFAPTNKRWDVDDVDEGHKYDKVINICARNGNAKAVELLIKHGADISRGVLHEIVLESVKKPEKIDQLMEVYQSIVDNAVTWHCLEKKSKFMKFRGSAEYSELLRYEMMRLLTNPVSREMYEGKDVLTCALDHGACAMFSRIINTKNVFRVDGRKARNWVPDEDRDEANQENTEDAEDDENEDCVMNKKQHYWTVFDVTHFTEETSQHPDFHSSKNASIAHAPSSTSDSARLSCREADREELTPITDDDNDDDENMATEKPHLTYMLSVFDKWKNSNILCTQPLKELIQPYIKCVQRFYFILGLLQFVFMVLFTGYQMPTTCSLALMFNVSNTRCNHSDSETASINFQQRSWVAVLWIIWPTILIAINIFITFDYVKQSSAACKQKGNKILYQSKDLRFTFLSKLLDDIILCTVIWRIFCIVAFVWLLAYFTSKSYEFYVEMTALVLLFGWIANFEFFGAVSKDFSIFELVVKKVIVKDIPSFMLFFGFTVIGYSFAMHALRLLSCTPTEVAHVTSDITFFSVLSIAFGIGEILEMPAAESKFYCPNLGTQYLFEVLYFLYVCATMIILLNVLIAMMNHRYEKVKPKTKNIWRFQMVSTMRAFQRHKWLVDMLKKFWILPVHIRGKKGCWSTNKHHVLLTFNEKLHRWYLRLVLAVDEEL